MKWTVTVPHGGPEAIVEADDVKGALAAFQKETGGAQTPYSIRVRPAVEQRPKMAEKKASAVPGKQSVDDRVAAVHRQPK